MHDLRRVILWMAGALISFSALAIAIRELARVITVWEVLALRNLGGVVALVAYAVIAGQRIGPPTPLRLHLLRHVIHYFGQACWSFGVTLLPLATVFALEFTTPAWTMVVAAIFLHERITAGRIAALVLGFIGVLVIVRPGDAAFDPASLIVLAAAMLFGVQITITKFLTTRNTTLTILFWMNLLQFPAYLATDLALGGSPLSVLHLPADKLLPLAMLLVSGLSAHVCFTNAMRYGDATLVVPIDFLRIPFIAAIGVVLYAEPFDLLVLLGAGISATGILWSLLEARNRTGARK